MIGVLEWLKEEAVSKLKQIKKARSKEEAPIIKQKKKTEKELKEEAAEEEKRKRLADKYTEKWDLCYAFFKHGKCKDKNCKWRHETQAQVEAREKAQKAAEAEEKAGEKAKAEVPTNGKISEK